MSLELHNAIRSCNFEEIKAALETHSNEINIPDPMLGWTPLYKAVLYRDYEITKLLLENGADPDQCNQVCFFNKNYNFFKLKFQFFLVIIDRRKRSTYGS